MYEETGQHEWFDIRRVIDRAACAWFSSGHARSLHMILPAGPLRAYGDCARLTRLLLVLMERASRSARRFDTMCLVVERHADQVVIHAGSDRRASLVVEIGPGAFDAAMQSKRPRRVDEPPSNRHGDRI